MLKENIMDKNNKAATVYVISLCPVVFYNGSSNGSNATLKPIHGCGRRLLIRCQTIRKTYNIEG